MAYLTFQSLIAQIKKPLLFFIICWGMCALAIIPVLGALSWLRNEVRVFAGISFEPSVRTAMAKGNYREAERICTGAARIWVGRQDVEGLSRLLRSFAFARQGKLAPALDDLKASAAFWCSQPWYSNELFRKDFLATAITLAQAYIQLDDRERATEALSVGARGTTAPGSFLKAVQEQLDPTIQSALWSDLPVLRVEGFEDDNGPKLEMRGTIGIVEHTGWDEDQHVEGKRSAVIRINQVDGKTARVAARLHLKLEPEDPFGLRFYARVVDGTLVGASVVYWADGPFLGAKKDVSPARSLEQGWVEFDMPPSVVFGDLSPAHAQALHQQDLEILDIEIHVTSQNAVTCHMDGIEVYATP